MRGRKIITLEGMQSLAGEEHFRNGNRGGGQWPDYDPWLNQGLVRRSRPMVEFGP